MKKKIRKIDLHFEVILVLLAFIFLLSGALNAQNLISNPGFEKCDLCGRFGNPGVEFFYLNGANTPVDWFGVTEGSSDIRSTLPNTGKRHGGFFSFGKYEYLGNVLTEALQSGAEYQFSFWLSVELAGGYSLDEIGVYFQSGLPKYSGLRYLGQSVNPQFTTPDGEYIPSSKYKKYSFTYKACGGEDHIVIGRFSNLGKNDTLYIGKGQAANVYPYTYVDDVELLKIKDSPNLLPDTISLCKYEKLKIGISGSYSDVKWSTGAIGDSIEVNSTHSIIYVEAKYDNNCPPIKDSIIVAVVPIVKDQVDLLPDTICLKSNLKLNASNPNYTNYLWNTGVIDSILEVKEIGKYTIAVHSNCNEASDQVQVISDFDLSKLFQFPNVFLPDQMENNLFLPVIQTEHQNKIQKYELNIFNRWGAKIFETTDFNKAWIPDHKVATDLYIYVVNCSINNCDKEQSINLKGTVNLVR